MRDGESVRAYDPIVRSDAPPDAAHTPGSREREERIDEQRKRTEEKRAGEKRSREKKRKKTGGGEKEKSKK